MRVEKKYILDEDDIREAIKEKLNLPDAKKIQLIVKEEYDGYYGDISIHKITAEIIDEVQI